MKKITVLFGLLVCTTDLLAMDESRVPRLKHLCEEVVVAMDSEEYAQDKKEAEARAWDNASWLGKAKLVCGWDKPEVPHLWQRTNIPETLKTETAKMAECIRSGDPLSKAAKNGYIDLMDHWLKKMPIIADRSSVLLTALNVAAGARQLEAVKFLISKGAEPGCRDFSYIHAVQDRAKVVTPLQHACSYSNPRPEVTEEAAAAQGAKVIEFLCAQPGVLGADSLFQLLPAWRKKENIPLLQSLVAKIGVKWETFECDCLKHIEQVVEREQQEYDRKEYDFHEMYHENPVACAEDCQKCQAILDRIGW